MSGRNRKQATRRLRAIEVEIDQGRYVPPENVRFADWADAWLAGVRREETTRKTYGSSLEYAKQVFGRKPLEQLTTSDVRTFLGRTEHQAAEIDGAPGEPVRTRSS